MHRTEGANYASGHLFTDGPPGTCVEEDWLNTIQEEIAEVIEQAGYTLKTASTDTRTQLWEAISRLLIRRAAGDFPNLIPNPSGYQGNLGWEGSVFGSMAGCAFSAYNADATAFPYFGAYFQYNNSVANSTYVYDNTTGKIYVSAGQELTVAAEVWASAIPTSGQIGVFVNAYTSGDVFISQVAAAYHTETPTGVEVVSDSGVAPTGVSYVRVFRFVYNPTVDAHADFQSARISRIKLNVSTLASPFSDEASTRKRCCKYVHENNLDYASATAHAVINYSTFKFGTGLSTCVSIGASWEFTADKNMLLKIAARQYCLLSGTNSDLIFYVAVSGLSYLGIARNGFSFAKLVNGWTTVELEAGETLHIELYEPGTSDGIRAYGTDEYNELFLEEI